MSLETWNARYRSGAYDAGAPSPLLIEAASSRAAGRALDLACGAGRNALWLARNGWDVVAIDGSEAAIEIVRAADSRIDARILDLEHNPLPFDDESFDLVCIFFFLHRPLFAEAQRVLRRGGLFVASIQTQASHGYTLRQGELRTYVDDAEIVSYSEENGVASVVAHAHGPQAS